MIKVSKLELLVSQFVEEVKRKPKDFSEGERKLALDAAKELNGLQQLYRVAQEFIQDNDISNVDGALTMPYDNADSTGDFINDVASIVGFQEED